MQTRLTTPLRVQKYWTEIIPYATAQNVSTLTTLLAFTDYGTEYESLAVILSNADATDTVTLIVDFSQGGTYKIDAFTQTAIAAPETEALVLVPSPNQFTYIRIAAQTESPFPTASIQWALLGIPR